MSEERRITAGGRALRVYLDSHGLSIPRFCEAHKLDRIHVQRVVNGDRWQRITVDFAQRIFDATNGDVDWRLFASNTAELAPESGDSLPTNSSTGTDG